MITSMGHSSLDFPSLSTDGEAYVNPWSSQCKRIAREKLKVLGDGANSFRAGKCARVAIHPVYV